ncbi:MAG: hypothetical protein KC983_04200 [Phycisphaerales bacterium]|nr:hypothetical protein [Phycisphaerales bacterium]
MMSRLIRTVLIFMLIGTVLHVASLAAAIAFWQWRSADGEIVRTDDPRWLGHVHVEGHDRLPCLRFTSFGYSMRLMYITAAERWNDSGYRNYGEPVPTSYAEWMDSTLAKAGRRQDLISTPTSKLRMYLFDPVDGNGEVVTHVAAGWPCESLVGVLHWGDHVTGHRTFTRLYGCFIQSHAGPVATDDIYQVTHPGRQNRNNVTRIPTHPRITGWIGNGAFYGSAAWCLSFVPFALRRMMRRRRGVCVRCAYPRGTSDVCTECGEILAGVRAPRCAR